MKTIKINNDNVLELLKQAVDTRGEDFVYSSDSRGCFYAPLSQEMADKYLSGTLSEYDNRRKTGCLIGTMFKVLGVPDEILEKYTDGGYVASLVDHLNKDNAAPNVQIDEDSLRTLQHAQHEQDAGGSWGQAYHACVEVYS